MASKVKRKQFVIGLIYVVILIIDTVKQP